VTTWLTTGAEVATTALLETTTTEDDKTGVV